MENAGQLSQKDRTPLDVIENNLQQETEFLVNIDGRLAQLPNRLRGSIPEGVSTEQEKACAQGAIGSVRERTETNQNIISRIQTQIAELEDIL